MNDVGNWEGEGLKIGQKSGQFADVVYGCSLMHKENQTQN